MSYLAFLFTIILSSAAYAEEPEDNENIVYKQKTEIDFEGLEIEGALVKPQGALLLDRKKASFNPLIKLRTDWDEEMSDSVNEIK